MTMTVSGRDWISEHINETVTKKKPQENENVHFKSFLISVKLEENNIFL